MKAIVFLLACATWAVVALGAEPHTWTDATGRFSVEAELVEVKPAANGNPKTVVLRRTDGNLIEVSFDQLGSASQRLANRLLKQREANEAESGGDAASSRTPRRRSTSTQQADQPRRLGDLFGNRMVLVKTEAIAEGRPVDVAADDKALYVLVRGHSQGRDAIFVLDRRSGEVRATHVLDKGGASGLCSTGGRLWVLGRSADRFLRQFDASGKVVRTWPLSRAVPGDYYGLAVDGRQVAFASQTDDQSTIWTYSTTTDRATRLCDVPGKIAALAFLDGKLHAQLQHEDLYSDNWLLVIDPLMRDKKKPDDSPPMRKLNFGKRTVVGLAPDGGNLLAMVRRGQEVEIHSVAVLDSRNLVLSRPVKRSVEVAWPVTNRSGGPVRFDFYAACPIDRPLQQVSNLSFVPAPQRLYMDRDGNQWAHIALAGPVLPTEIKMKFDIVTVDGAQTFDREYVARPADFPPIVLREFLRETYCFDYSHPAVAALHRKVPAAETLFDRMIAVRNVVNDALRIDGASGHESKASDFLLKGVGRCYAHTLAFGALARRSGIPTRAIGGISLLKGSVHTWNEIYVPGVGWLEIDITSDDDDAEGRHTHKYIGYHRGSYVITFEGSYDRADLQTVFAQRSWNSRFPRATSLDRRVKADVTVGELTLQATELSFE